MARADYDFVLFLLPDNVETPELVYAPLNPRRTTTIGVAYLEKHETPQILALVEAVRDIHGRVGRSLVLV